MKAFVMSFCFIFSLLEVYSQDLHVVYAVEIKSNEPTSLYLRPRIEVGVMNFYKKENRSKISIDFADGLLSSHTLYNDSLGFIVTWTEGVLGMKFATKHAEKQNFEDSITIIKDSFEVNEADHVIAKAVFTGKETFFLDRNCSEYVFESEDEYRQYWVDESISINPLLFGNYLTQNMGQLPLQFTIRRNGNTAIFKAVQLLEVEIDDAEFIFNKTDEYKEVSLDELKAQINNENNKLKKQGNEN